MLPADRESPPSWARWLDARRLGFCLAAALALAVGLLVPEPAAAQTTARDTLPVVRKVQFQGNSAFADGEVRRAIATRASGCKSVLLSPLCWLGWGAFVRTERFDARELRTDVARIRVFYYRRGFRNAQIDTTVVHQDGFVDVAFAIAEGEPVIVRELQVRGLEEISDAGAIISELQLSVGQPFSEVDMTASQERIERELRKRGYADAAVLKEATIPSSDTLGAFVVLEAVPGPRSRIGEVEVVGTVQIDPEDVKRLLTFRSGDVYNEDEIVRSQRTLYSLALFDYVDITRGLTSPDSTIDVRVQINEARLRGVQFGVGLSTTECFQVEAAWSHRNIFGGTRSLELRGVLSNLGTAQLARQFPCTQAGVERESGLVTDPYNKINWRLRADFRQPWFLGTENWLRLGVFGERQSLPGIYTRVSYGGDVQLSREISPGTALIGTYRAGRDSLEEGSADFLFCANFLICTPEDIGLLEQPRWLSWVAVTFARSRTDAVLNPTRGYRFTIEGETASRFTGSEWAYYRAQGEVSWFQRFGRNVLALRVRGGLVRPIGSGIEGVDLSTRSEPVTHPLKRQYAGGAFTVRGFGQNLLGPLVLLTNRNNLEGCLEDPVVTENNTWVCNPIEEGLTSDQVFPRPVGGENSIVANAELRVPFGAGRWVGVAFVDLGQVWTVRGEVSSADRLAWSPGVGIRYQSPVGPLRLDIGYNTSGSKVYPVVSELENEEGEAIIVQLGDANDKPHPFEYDPFEGSGFSRFLSRLQLHFSIGHAF
ncbi:MAG: BamA/TamA family outer membrane protein [Gemmatimonadota bacterium]|nr:MAG: BamA/TamA family outer membrane protein [Gemmatimonadota bacterium]